METIDHLLQRLDNVKTYQDHLKLITTSLNRLRDQLRSKNSTTSNEILDEHIRRTLAAIDEVIVNCDKSNNNLNELILLQLYLRLSQHEADLTENCETKIQILSNACREQTNLIQKSFDEISKQRLAVTKQCTDEKITEQLRVLHERHSRTLNRYLRGCIDSHKNESLVRCTGDTVAKVARTIYEISSEQYNQLKHQWKPYGLPFIRTLIQFKNDKQISLGRNQFQGLLSERNGDLLQAVDQQEDNLTTEDGIHTRRCIVILGDPGSGKTGFIHSLTHHLATELLNGQYTTEYGPIRIPIFIRINEFVQKLKQQPSLTLFQHIVKTTDHLVSSVLQHYIAQGHASIIFDGLDEIHTTSQQRSLIINAIETFTTTSTSDDSSQLRHNQLIVTSRTTSYHTSPLSHQFTPFIIEPLNIDQMKVFINHWFSNIHQQIIDKLQLALPSQAQQHAQPFIKLLEDCNNDTLRDIASHPSLLSSLCSMFFNQSDPSIFTTHHTSFYEQLIHSTIDSFTQKHSTISKIKLIRIFTDLAFHIHKYSTSNSIDLEEINDVCFQAIKTFKNKKLLTSEDMDTIETEARNAAQTVREEIAILTRQHQLTYAFRHSAFQEYFTSLKLIEVDKSRRKSREDEIRFIVQSLHHYLDNSRFRVSIALALGNISSSWPQNDFDQFCHAFIEYHNESDSLMPLGPYILVTSIDQLSKYPSNDVLFNALNRLIIAAAQHQWSLRCPFLFDQIANAMRKCPVETILQWVDAFVMQSPTQDIQVISALCDLLEGKAHEFDNLKWLNHASCSALQSFSNQDNDKNGYAIDRLLIKIAFSNHRLLPVHSHSLKEFLLNQDNQSELIPISLLPLIIMLYGGLKRNDENVIVFDAAYIHRESTILTPMLIRFLSIKDRGRQDQGWKKLKGDCMKSFVSKLETRDESSETVDLCLATICLCGMEYVQDNLTIIAPSVLEKSTNRLKYLSMMLRQLYFPSDSNDRSVENEATKFISLAIEKFQYGESGRVQFLDMLNMLRSGVARLRTSTMSLVIEGDSDPQHRVTLNLPDALRKEEKFLSGLLSTDIRVTSDRPACSLLPHFIKLFWILEQSVQYDTQYRMAVAMDTIPDVLIFRNDEDVLIALTFVPSHLRNLYIRLWQQKRVIIHEHDIHGKDGYYVGFGHILTECCMKLSSMSCKRLVLLDGLIALLPWLRMMQLENFGGSLLWPLATKYSDYMAMFESVNEYALHYETGQYINRDTVFPSQSELRDDVRQSLMKEDIEQECQRLQNALTSTDGKNTKLYGASVSLAYICRWGEDGRISSSIRESIRGAMLITNKLIRLDALCVIALYSHSNYNQIRTSSNKSLDQEIEHQLNDIYSTLPLLLHAAIFIRCLPLLSNQDLIRRCLKNLFEKFADNDRRDQQAVYEALSPYLQSNPTFSSVTNYTVYSFSNDNRTIHNQSAVLKKYLNMSVDLSSSFSVCLSNLYLMELMKDLHECVRNDLRQFTNDESIVTRLCLNESSLLTEAQALAITDIISDVPRRSKKLLSILNEALHHKRAIEFKARRTIELWLSWTDSPEQASFAYHAALLLTNSDLWSVEAVNIVCDLLCNENDRFRHRTEELFRQSNDNDVRTTSKMGLDVLLALMKKRAYFHVTSASAKLTLGRLLGNVTLDVQSHLETLLWLERYRIHALNNKDYFSNQPIIWTNPYVTSYFSPDVPIDTCPYINTLKMTGDLVVYMCDMIGNRFFSFMEIDQSSMSNAVSQSYNQFVVYVLVTTNNLLNHDDFTRELAMESLMNLFEMSDNDDIRQAVAYVLGYVGSGRTYKSLFEKIQILTNNGNSETFNCSDRVLATFIASYAYCLCIHSIPFDQDDMDLLSNLMKHPSDVIQKSIRTAYGRVLTDQPLLQAILNIDYIECYHALIGATAYLFLYNVQENSEKNIAIFIENHPAFLPLFITELYNSIQHFTNNVLPIGGKDYDLAYGHPQYVKIASIIATNIPTAFCSFVNNWSNGDQLKRALYYTSKQHNFPQRASCLTILSTFGELTVELCEMLMNALFDDPHVQNTCYKCLSHIKSIKDEKAVLDQLLSYLKSKSMNVRYVAAKVLIHLCQSCLIGFKQVKEILHDVISDPQSNEGLWLIVEQDTTYPDCTYYYAGPLNEAVYTLLIQYLANNTSENIKRNEFNDIDSDFIASEKASRLASCLYETRTQTETRVTDGEELPPTPGSSPLIGGDLLSSSPPSSDSDLE